MTGRAEHGLIIGKFCPPHAGHHLLIRSAAALERLRSVDTVVFDKTGTLTVGRPSVTDLVVAGRDVTEDDLLALAAAVEQGSEHPIGEAIVRRAKDCGLALPPVGSFVSVPGQGVDALAPDGRALLDYDKATIHRQVAFVFQDATIFNLTLRENIGFSRTVTDQDLEKAIGTAELADFVRGLAQGLGGALFEEFLYDEAGAPLATTFADYLIPTAREVPAVDVLLTEDAPSPRNPLGLKGAGEGGVNAVGAAIAAAIDAAIGRPGAVTRLPVTPARLHALLKEIAG